MRNLLWGLALDLLTPEDVGPTPGVEETGRTYAENARLKALTLARATGHWALADDTGLEVDALDGAPGLRSARLVPSAAGAPHPSDADRRRRLLEMLSSYPRPWTARFRCVIALASPRGKVDQAEGVCPGEIIPEERGSSGFGYDPLFKLEASSKTMAELSLRERNRLSHRARAVTALLPVLCRRLEIPLPPRGR